MKKYFFVTILIFFSFLGCNNFNLFEGLKPKTDVRSRVKSDIERYKFNKIAILIFELGEGVPKEGREIENIFYEKLLQVKRYRVYPSYLAEEVAQRMNINLEKDYSIKKAIEIGRNMDVDAILWGRVTRYKELEGYRWGAKSPASVGFEVYLIEVKSGTVLWSGSFNKTEEALTRDASNIKAFIKGGGVWHKRYELARMGVEEILKRFPGLEEERW